MHTEIRDGTLITDLKIDHPLAKKYYSKKIVRLHPDVVTKIGCDVPEFRHLLDHSYHTWEYYKKWSQRREDVSRIKKAKHFSFNHDFKLPPFEHQKQALAFVLHTPSQALFAETGTGKTYVALLASEIRKMRGKVNKVLVISPASILRTGWYEDMKKFTDLKGIIVHPDRWRWSCPECGVSHIRHDKAQKHMDRCGVEGRPDEELMWNDLESVTDKVMCDDYDIYMTSINLAHLYADDFKAAGFDFVILDESTMIKNPSGEWRESIHSIGWKAKYRLAMTGMPVVNELEDIWGQMNFVDHSFDRTIGRFRQKYYWQHPVHHYIKEPKDGAKEKIADIVRPASLRIKKEDCLDLPERTSRIMEVPISDKVRKHYNRFYKELWTRHKGEVVVGHNVFTEILRLHQILNGFWTKPGEDDVIKIDEPRKATFLRDEIMPTVSDKVIVWTWYRYDARQVAKVLNEYNPAIVNGSTKNVEKEVNKFLYDDSSKVMIAHPKSAKFGHTWTVASTTVFYTYSYDYEDFLQARDRNYRIGQDKSVTELILSHGGIEGKILNSIMKKQDFSRDVMQNITRALRNIKL